MIDDLTLKEIEKMLVSFAQKQKEERDDLEERITKSISIQKQATDNKLAVPDDDFLFDANIRSITPFSKESFALFGNRLKELMKQSGIVVVNASLIKKF
jgi:hypothetical protein